nr:diguanylate cyclase [Aromatoleum toluvorans]
MLEDIQTPEDAHEVADKIRETISHPFDLDARILRTRASIGVAFHPGHGQDPDDILKHADEAMYADKQNKPRPSA